MTGDDWIMVAWGVGGVVAGLAAANWVYVDDSHRSVNAEARALDALCGFVCVVVFFPVLLALAGVALLAWSVGWSLPAVRRERQERRAAAKHDADEATRWEIDKLHSQVGLPPVDWTSGMDAP